MTELLLDAKVMGIAQALERARIPYAFGGAIALAYYAAPRASEDIDINVFSRAEKAGKFSKALERLGIESHGVDRDTHPHQRLLLWEHTPIHVFFSYDPFSRELQGACPAGSLCRWRDPDPQCRGHHDLQGHLRPAQGSQ